MQLKHKTSTGGIGIGILFNVRFKVIKYQHFCNHVFRSLQQDTMSFCF